MKILTLNLLKFVLKHLARRTIAKYRPGIVGITGSVGKTSTKLTVAAVLGSERDVRAASGNFNNELGLPLTVLGGWQKIHGPFFWVWVVFVSLARLVWRSRYPEILILEYAIDRPGDMTYLLQIAKPNVSVITAVGEIPVHVEFFSGPEEIAREKGRLIEALVPGGFAVLNQDDETVMALRERTRARVMTFGFDEYATVRARNFENIEETGTPKGIRFRLEYGGNAISVHMPNVFGKVQAYAAAAAANVGLIFGVDLTKISEALTTYKPAERRLNLLHGVRDSLILDDTYNASPLSMHAALHILKDLSGKRKIAVLGDMLEIGEYSVQAHERVGKLAAKLADKLITVGPRGKLIADAAKKAGMNRRNVTSFDLAEDAAKEVYKSLKKGDLALVKGSHAMRLEKIVDAIKVESLKL